MKPTQFFLASISVLAFCALPLDIVYADPDSDDIIYVRSPETIEVSTYLPRAAENGHWVGSWTTGAGRKEVGGSYAATWSKVEGEWKIRSEMFVTLFCNGPGC